MSGLADLADRLHALASKYARIYRFLAPAAALASGLVSVFLLRRGVDFAPVAVAGIAIAWTLASIFARTLAPRSEGEAMGRRLARFLAHSIITGTYQSVLFFLLPVWFGSATWPSRNIVAPIVLALMALVSCFDRFHAEHVLHHPARRAAFSAVVLFATLVAAVPVFARVPLRANFAAAAAASAILGSVAALPLERLRSRRVLFAIFAVTLASAALMAIAAPMFPPVPVECVKSAAAHAILDREPDGESDVFDPGVEIVYVWFAVAAPNSYSEKIRFEWSHDGHPLEKGFETRFTGGRKTGFRTWGYATKPRSGTWTVELYAGSDQLVARHRFVVR